MSRRLIPLLAVAALACGKAEGSPELLETQRAVWETWFEGDTLRLQELYPEDLVAINTGGGDWGGRAEMIRASVEFRAQGGELVSLTFPRMEIQELGDVAIVYSNYEVVSCVGADTTREAGRATEIFVRRGGKWVNPGWHLDSGR